MPRILTSEQAEQLKQPSSMIDSKAELNNTIDAISKELKQSHSELPVQPIADSQPTFFGSAKDRLGEIVKPINDAATKYGVFGALPVAYEMAKVPVQGLGTLVNTAAKKGVFGEVGKDLSNTVQQQGVVIPAQPQAQPAPKYDAYNPDSYANAQNLQPSKPVNINIPNNADNNEKPLAAIYNQDAQGNGSITTDKGSASWKGKQLVPDNTEANTKPETIANPYPNGKGEINMITGAPVNNGANRLKASELNSGFYAGNRRPQDVQKTGGRLGGMPILDHTASTRGGSTPQERYAIQQQELPQELEQYAREDAAKVDPLEQRRMQLLDVLNEPLATDIAGRVVQAQRQRTAKAQLGLINDMDRNAAYDRNTLLDARATANAQSTNAAIAAAKLKAEKNTNKYKASDTELDPFGNLSLNPIEGPEAESIHAMNRVYNDWKNSPVYEKLLMDNGYDTDAGEDDKENRRIMDHVNSLGVRYAQDKVNRTTVNTE